MDDLGFAPTPQLRVLRVEEDEEGPSAETCESQAQGSLRDQGVSDEDWAELEAAKLHFSERIERLKREQREEELRQELLKHQAMQEKIRKLCPCPAGYSWSKVGGGWRCHGGSHFVTDRELQEKFTA